MVDWQRFQVDTGYRLEILQSLLKTEEGRSILSEIIQEIHQDWQNATLTEKVELIKLDYLLKAAQGIEADTAALFPQSQVSGVSFTRAVKWVGVGALTAVAGVGLLRFVPAAASAVASGIGIVGGLLVRGGAVALPAAWKWATASGWRALGVSLGLVFTSQLAYSKIIGKKSWIEKAVDKSGQIITAAPAAIKSGMLLAIALIGALALYNITKKE